MFAGSVVANLCLSLVFDAIHGEIDKEVGASAGIGHGYVLAAVDFAECADVIPDAYLVYCGIHAAIAGTYDDVARGGQSAVGFGVGCFLFHAVYIDCERTIVDRYGHVLPFAVFD